jgi:hypothetical protein
MNGMLLCQATAVPFLVPAAPIPSQRAREHSKIDWENQRSNIEKLYFVENKPLKTVIRCLSQSHGFFATYGHPIPLKCSCITLSHEIGKEADFLRRERQLKRKIKDWGIDKNIKTNEMKAIVRKRMERKVMEDKESAFRVRGRNIAPAKIRRWEDRQRDVNTSMTMHGTPVAGMLLPQLHDINSSLY